MPPDDGAAARMTHSTERESLYHYTTAQRAHLQGTSGSDLGRTQWSEGDAGPVPWESDSLFRWQELERILRHRHLPCPHP